MTDATFLHLTDAHLSTTGVPFRMDDHKVRLPRLDHPDRAQVLDLLLSRVAERLDAAGRRIDAVLFSGDAQERGGPGGHRRVLDILLHRLARCGIGPERIVAVPGNHDVPKGSDPSSTTRYSDFVAAWKAAGCVVPWLDGEPLPTQDELHRFRLLAPDRSWVVLPLNTSNWCQVRAELPSPLKEAWPLIPDLLEAAGAGQRQVLLDQLEKLVSYDVARVSGEQMEIMREVARSTPAPASGSQTRIMVMHHHLRNPDLREEIRPFADLVNVELVRRFIRENRINVVVHGHKHQQQVGYDHDAEGAAHRRTLLVSGGTFDEGRERDAARILTLGGLPNLAALTVTTFSLPRSGSNLDAIEDAPRPLWSCSEAGGAPTVVQGSDLNEVYERACDAATNDAKGGILVVHLDLPDDQLARILVPKSYPYVDGLDEDRREEWFGELVSWWQLDRSKLESRIPYIHGNRLRRYAGGFDQIARIVRLLRGPATTKAIAVLVDPLRDFDPEGRKERFASFCLVEFKRREDGDRKLVDAIAFYRTQEFAKWWPINVAELRHLQREIGGQVGLEVGRITTICADARVQAPSPSAVTMPILDRWLDQAPERLHLLAQLLVQGAPDAPRRDRALADWRLALVELRASTKRYNPDGNPLSVEGLSVLGSFVRESGGPEAGRLAGLLEDLATINDSIARTTEREAFERLAASAERRIQELESFRPTTAPAGH